MEWLIGQKRLALRRMGFRSVPNFLKNPSPIQLLVLGYFLITLAVACLLMLPLASATNKSQPFIDALFVASSGISTTGLTPVDVGKYYSMFGQIVLMTEFQIGGLGYMAIFVLLASFLQKNLSIKTRLMAIESVAGAHWRDGAYFFRKIIAFTLFFELSGALILAGYWAKQFPLPRALYLGIFHSVSAFCTAGFSLFSDSLASFQNSVLVNSMINIISLCGAIGFFVLAECALLGRDVVNKRRRKRLSTHTQLAVLVTLVVISIGTAIIFFSEKWPPKFGFFQRVMLSSFQAISASTTDGFNTMKIGEMTASSLFMIVLLMLIGASSGSTGGGIKTTTLGAIFLAVKAQLVGHKDSNFFGRRITDENIRKSFSIFFLFTLVMIIDVLIISRTEKIPFLPLVFETASALGNTGLSTGVTAGLSWLGKLLLSITMFIGRVGPITIGMALVGKRKYNSFHYPNGDVFIG